MADIVNVTVGDNVLLSGGSIGGTDGNDFPTSGVLTGTNLTLTIPNQADVVVDLSTLLDNTDGQTVTDLSLTGNILSITLSGGNTATVDLSTLNVTMSDAQIKAAYENNLNTNAFTDAEQSKLGAISGTNTGDQTLSLTGQNLSISGGNTVALPTGGATTNNFNNEFRDSTGSGLVGVQNGTNTTFTVSQSQYQAGSVKAYLNGQLLWNGAGITETTPATGVITFETAPLATDGLYIEYVVGVTNSADLQEKITLTTTGTSGAATLTANTLNIPQYSGGGGGSVNTFTATSIADLQNVANVGKIASIESIIDLGTATVTLQENMGLKFNGGSFSNGTISWNNNPIEANAFEQIFATNISHTGKAFHQDVYAEWFGVVANGVTPINIPNDKGVSYMRLCFGGSYIFSDISNDYIFDIYAGTTAITNAGGQGRLTGMEYSASNTTLVISEGVNLQATNHPLESTGNIPYAVVGLYGKNIKVTGGGKITGTEDVTPQSDIQQNGVCIMAFWDSDNFTIDNIELYRGGDGFAPMPLFNFVASWTDRPESFTLGNVDATGLDIVSTTTIRSKQRQSLGSYTRNLGFTILQNGAYQSYPVLDNETKGRYDVYFYDAATGGNFLGRVLNQSMYERVYFPTGTTHLQVVLHTVGTTLTGTVNSTYNSELTGSLKSFDMQFRPTLFPVGGKIINCKIHLNARNGISVTSIQGLLIESNTIHDQRGNGILESAIDFEEGYYLNRRHIVSKNTMYNNGTIDIAILRISDVKVINNFFKRSDNLEPNQIKMSADFAENFLVTGNSFDGGSLSIKTGLYDSNIFTDMAIQLKSGALVNSELTNSEIQIDAEDNIHVKDARFFNNNDKQFTSHSYTIIGADGDKLGKGSVLDAIVSNVPATPLVILEDITIKGVKDKLKTIQVFSKNSYWKNIKIETKADNGAIVAISASQVDGFDFDGVIGITDNGGQNRYRNLTVQGFYLDTDFANLDVRDSKFFTTVYNRDTFRMPNGRIVNNVTIKDNNFSWGSNTSSTRVFANNGTVSNFRFDGNQIIYPTVSTNLFTMTGTTSGYFLYRNNIVTGALFNPITNAISENNVIGGRSRTILPLYADNAAALTGGLIAEQKYRTATGELKIVY
jgi:hypothetical protein